MKRTAVINKLAAAIGAAKYLEIGTRTTADNFDGIRVLDKTGVDPKGDGAKVLRMTSDEFFSDERGPFDLVFIDGDHREEQVRRDVKHALKCLAPGGIVVMHDCLPANADEALPEKPHPSATWCGEAWRTYAYYRGLKSYATACVNTDHGIGMIRKRRKGEKGNQVKDAAAPWTLKPAERAAAYNLVEPGDLDDFLADWL